MTRLGSPFHWAKAATGALCCMALAIACDDDGKTAPERCSDPPLEIYDIASAPDGRAGQQGNPCVTPIGDAFSPPSEVGVGGDAAGGGGTGGTSSAGTANGGTSAGGEGGTEAADGGGAGGADAGAGGGG